MEFNHRKAAILIFISNAKRSVTAKDLIFNQDLSSTNAYKRLSRMCGQGYLRRWGRGKYGLAAKGERVKIRLRNRMQVEQITGIKVSLNLQKTVSWDIQQKFKESTGSYPTNL